MKHIVLVLGSGLNERGWAKDFSKFGRVTLIQIGFFEHVEIWEHEQRIYCGPEIKTPRKRKWDERFFGMLSFFSTISLVLRFSKGIKIDLLVTGFHSSGLAALLLHWFFKVKKIAFFLVDRMPFIGPWYVRLHRLMIKLVIRFVTGLSDEVWLLSPRIRTAHPATPAFVVPMYISTNPTPAGPREEIVYIGHPSYDHALDILFEICKKNSLRMNVIGDSHYLRSIKHLAPPDAVFHGLINDEKKIGEILGKCFCGYAIYRNTGPTSYSYYGFPSKTLFYFASNVPIVITNVAYFNENFEKRGVGRVVEPTQEEIEKAILQLKKNYEAYSQAIDRFRLEWNAEVDVFHREHLTALLTA